MRIALIAEHGEPCLPLAENLRADGHDVHVLPPGVLPMAQPDDALLAEPYRFHPSTGEVFLHGEAIRLTARELDLALYLFRRRGERLSRADISQDVWGHGPAIESRTLDAHVSKLRRKLKLGVANGYRLLALYAHGYQLAPVR